MRLSVTCINNQCPNKEKCARFNNQPDIWPTYYCFEYSDEFDCFAFVELNIN